MNILVLSNRIPWPLSDGWSLVVWNEMDQLRKFGHKLTLAALNTLKHRQDPAVLENDFDVHAVDIDTTVTPMGIIRNLRNEMPYNIIRFDAPEMHQLLEQLLTANQYDVILIHGSFMAIYAGTIRQFTDKPIVMRSHNVEYRIWERLAEQTFNPLKKWYLNDLAKKIKAFELKSMHQFSGIIAITEADESWYKKSGFEKPAVTVNAGVDIASHDKKKQPKSGTVAFLGSLEWMPNIQGLNWFLDKVWPKVLDAKPEAKFYIAGRNPSAKMKRLKRKGVKMLGEVPSAPDFIKRYEIFVIPLLSGGGMRLKLVEGLAAGKAIVSTTVGAEGVAYEAGRDLLIADEPQAFADAVIRIMEDRALAARLEKNARDLAERKYGWESLVRKMEGFLAWI